MEKVVFNLNSDFQHTHNADQSIYTALTEMTDKSYIDKKMMLDILLDFITAFDIVWV